MTDLRRGDFAAIAGWQGTAIPCKILTVRMMRHQYSDASFPVAIVRVTADRPGYARGDVCERSELLTRDNRWARLTCDMATRCATCGASWSGGTYAVAGILHMSAQCPGTRAVLTASDDRALHTYADGHRVAGRPIYGASVIPIYSAG